MKKIVLAGGPCSGKTSVLEYIKSNNSCLDIGFERIVTIDEVATELLRRNPDIRRDPLLLQHTILHMQLEAESVMASVFADRNTLLILDRGLLDAEVYLPSPFFKALCKRNSITIEEMMSHYDAVYFLESSSRFFENTEIRGESIEEAKTLCRVANEVWRKHPHFFFVPATDTEQEKIDSVIKTIRDTCSAWNK